MSSRACRNFSLLLFSTALLLGVVRDASACQCVARPTVLDAFERADEVVLAKATALEPHEGYSNVIRMEIENVFKGNLKVKEQIVFGRGGGTDCIWTFRQDVIGQRFLFYLNRPESSAYPYMAPREPGLWFAFVCGRSIEAEGAMVDLLYLENLSKVQGKTRISGTIGRGVKPASDVDGMRIKFIGPTETYETKTNKDGVFEIYDLPPGKYVVEPEIPPGWKILPFSLEPSPSVVRDRHGEPEMKTPQQVAIVLEANKHAEIDIDFVRDP